MTGRMLGALAPVHTGVDTLRTYAHGKLPPAPAKVDVPSMPAWGMLGNGPDPALTVGGGRPLGDCTIAGAAHLLMAANVQVGRHDPTPNSDKVADQYLTLSGGADTGLAEADVLTRWHTDGLFGGNKIAGFATVDHTDILDIHQAIACYGSCYVGVALPASADQQFAARQPWTVVGDRPVGGHCVVFVGYDARYLHAITWGAVQAVTYPWFATYGTEAHAVIPEEFVEAGHGPELDLASMQADIASFADRRRLAADDDR